VVRVVVIAGLMTVVSGCFPLADGPGPCTKTGVDAYGAPVCPLTAAQVSALPEASLIYPGSIRLWSNAESGALNVNGEPTDADTYSALETTATPFMVQVWYEDKLRAAGWTHFQSGPYAYIRYPPSSTYCELYSIDAYSAPPPGSRDPLPPAGGAYYMFRLSVPSTDFTRVNSPDASGNVSSVKVQCSALIPPTP
jgi:hypothetical protein